MVNLELPPQAPPHDSRKAAGESVMMRAVICQAVSGSAWASPTFKMANAPITLKKN
jgi:hypothetical protein